MKTITSSVGILALGAASLHAVYAPGLTTSEASKRWTLSAGVRGFYDDNYNTAPSATSEESFGFEVNPRIGFNLPMDQTLITGSYDFSGRYYADRPDGDWDMSHVFTLSLDHAFSERYSVKAKNTFAVTQDPEIFDATPGTFLRSNGDNIRNNADIVFRGDFSKTLGYELGYANNFYDFDQEGVGSYSALLDRVEHLPSASLRWFVQPQTTGILGYQFRQVSYAGDFELAAGVSAKIRNSRSHTVFVGVDHDFSSQLRASVRGGVSYTDSYNANTDSTDPYADVSLTYSYSGAGYVQVGVKHQRTQTDVLGGNAASPVLAQQSTTVYGSVSHKFTEFLSSSLLAFYQDSSFDGGTLDGQNESYASVGINLKYDFTRHLSAEAGYSLDNLESDAAAREFTRNRFFVGLRATY